MDVSDRGGGEGFQLEEVAGGPDDVVELVGAVLGREVEEGLDVGFDGGFDGEVAGEALETGFRVWVGGEELGDLVVDLGLARAGDGDVGAGFEARFGHGVAKAGCPAEDEDAGAGKLGGEFGGHCSGG